MSEPAEIEPDGYHCPRCGEPRPHFDHGLCELCCAEIDAASEDA